MLLANGTYEYFVSYGAEPQAQAKQKQIHGIEGKLQVSQQGLNLIKQFEGYRSERYLDAAGKPTIGYGHLITKGENLQTITREEATTLLKKDVQTASDAVRRLVIVQLKQNQYDALVSFTYNLGEGNLEKSTLLKKINMQDYRGASEEFTKWVYAGGKKLKGLEIRRAKEKELFLTLLE